jgi:manganese efflux pump family protein
MNGIAGMAAAGVGVGAASGADNFRAAIGLALVDRAAARRWVRLLIGADAAGLVVGTLVGSALPLALADAAPTIGLAALGLFAAIAILGADDLAERLVASRSLSITVPVFLSIDNVAAGAALGSLGYPLIVVVPVAVATSSMLCMAGYLAGSAAHAPRFAGSSARLGGVVLAIGVAIAIANG